MSIDREQIEPRMRSVPGARGSSFEGMSGQFPRPGHYLGNSLNHGARGARASRNNELYSNAGVGVYRTAGARHNAEQKIIKGNSEYYSSRQSGTASQVNRSQYPLNQINETESGHIIELDDTPGHQRILIKHNTGSGVELRNDGSVLIATAPGGNREDGVQGSYTLVVEADGSLVFRGNLNIVCNGDFNLDVKGNYNVNVEGDKNETITGSSKDRVHGNKGSVITGNSSTTVVGQTTGTHLGGLSENVKGSSSHNVDGSANFLAQGDVRFASSSKINMSSPDINIAANSLSVFGDTGTIGGENIIMYNYNMYTGHSIDAGDTITTTTFYGTTADVSSHITTPVVVGSLSGTASNANSSPLGPGGTVASPTASDEAVDVTATALPTEAILTDYLTHGTGGVSTVTIDAGNFIKNALNVSAPTDGLITRIATTGKMRSKLRDPANRENEKFIKYAMQTGTISEKWDTPTPDGIGRIVSRGGASPGLTALGTQGGLKPYRLSPSQGVTITPDPQYNPFVWVQDAQVNGGSTDITPSLPLAAGITLAKFLGSEDDPTTLSHILSMETRLQLAKYYYVHATHMKSIQENTGPFRDVSLVVTEGLYKPGPQETITKDSINDLKSTGRAVVYNVIDSTGRPSLGRLFDVASYWKDILKFDKMVLSYDTIDGELHGRIIMILPEIDDQWNGTFKRAIETEFNTHKLSEDELIEVVPEGYNTTSGGVALEPPGTVGQGYTGDITGDLANLDRRLLQILEAAAAEANVNVVVTSGNRGSGGSGRHSGYAADVSLYSGGKKLTLGTHGSSGSQDTAIIRTFIAAFISNARSKGLLPSVGAANNELSRAEYAKYVSSSLFNRPGGALYMGGTAVHVDIARGLAIGANRGYVWGGSEETANVPPPTWLSSLF